LAASAVLIATQVVASELQKRNTKKEIRAKISELLNKAKSNSIAEQEFLDQLKALNLRGEEADKVQKGTKKEKYLDRLCW